MKYIKLFENYNSFELLKDLTYKKLYVSYDIYFLFDYDDIDDEWSLIFGRIFGDINDFNESDFYKKIKFTPTGLNKPFQLMNSMCDIIKDFLNRNLLAKINIMGIYGEDDRDMRNSDNGEISKRTKLYYRSLSNNLDNKYNLIINGNTILVSNNLLELTESVMYNDFDIIKKENNKILYKTDDIYFYFQYYPNFNEWDMIFGTIKEFDIDTIFDGDITEKISFDKTGNSSPFKLVKTMCNIIENFLKDKKVNTVVSMYGVYDRDDNREDISKRAKLYYRALTNYLIGFKITLEGSYIYIKKVKIRENVAYDNKFINNFYTLFNRLVFVKDVDTWGDDYKVSYITKDGDKEEYVGSEKDIYDDFINSDIGFKILKPKKELKPKLNKKLKPTKMFNLVYKYGIHSEVVEKNIPYGMCVWYKKKYLREETKYNMGKLVILPV